MGTALDLRYHSEIEDVCTLQQLCRLLLPLTSYLTNYTGDTLHLIYHKRISSICTRSKDSNLNSEQQEFSSQHFLGSGPKVKHTLWSAVGKEVPARQALVSEMTLIISREASIFSTCLECRQHSSAELILLYQTEMLLDCVSVREPPKRLIKPQC